MRARRFFRAGASRPRIGHRPPTSGHRSCVLRRRLRARQWRQGNNRSAIEPKSTAQGKAAASPSSIFQLDHVDPCGFFSPDDRAHESGGDIFEDHARLNVDLSRARAMRVGTIAMRVKLEDICAIRVIHHPAIVRAKKMRLVSELARHVISQKPATQGQCDVATLQRF